MKHLLFILSLMLLAGTAYSQENRIKPEKNIVQAPGANYIMLSDVAGDFQIVPSSSLPGGGGGGGDVVQNFTYNGDVVTITTDQNVFSINVNANTVETTAPISINGNVYPSGTDIQTILGGIGVAINNISLVDNGDGTYTFTDTDGTTIAINTVRRVAFYHYPGSNNSYALPLDTLAKYDLLTITMRHSIGLSPTLSLPAFPQNDIYNGKTIVIHFEGSEVLDTIFVETTGLSKLVQQNCYAAGRTAQRDTILVDQYNPQMIIYRTNYLDDYFRQCEGLITLNDGNIVLPGDTFPDFAVNLNNTCECDTIYQVSHSFSVGDLLGQSPGNGAFFAANTASADAIPIYFVSESLHTDTFIVKSEGWLMDWTHGRLVGRDYFLQDDGSLDTIPDADVSVFAFHTARSNRAYFDIPEYIASQSNGGGSGGANVTASNGLNDADGGADIDVELGGALQKNTTINQAGFFLKMESNNSVLDIQADDIRFAPSKINEPTIVQGAFIRKESILGANATTEYAPYGMPLQKPTTFATEYLMKFGNDNTFDWVRVDPTGSGVDIVTTTEGLEEVQRAYLGGTLLQNTQIGLDNQYFFEIRDVQLGAHSLGFKTGPTEIGGAPGHRLYANTIDGAGAINGNSTTAIISQDEIELEAYDNSGNLVEFIINKNYIKATGIPNYANDAAADADATLPIGGIYTVTAEDRSLRIKP